MYGEQYSNSLSLTVSRPSHRLGQFVLFILLMNFMFTATLSANIMYMNDDFQAWADSFVSCTPQGLKRISLDENGNPVEDDRDRLEYGVCCLPFQKAALGPSNFGDDCCRQPYFLQAPIQAVAVMQVKPRVTASSIYFHPWKLWKTPKFDLGYPTCLIHFMQTT